jgi:hypothetical protein
MDPLSVVTSVLSISTICVHAIKSLRYIRVRCADADLTVRSLCTESNAINTSLCEIRRLFMRDGVGMVADLESRPEVMLALDESLTCCMMVFSCLEVDIRKLIPKDTRRFKWIRKTKIVWNEQAMMGYINQLRGQQAMLGLLLQSLQLYNSPFQMTLLGAKLQ